jgi:ABC-type uncharacterized transport system permease subunit
VCAPVELFLGRLQHASFVRGALVLLLSIALLEVARHVLWKRGVRRYAGAGM